MDTLRETLRYVHIALGFIGLAAFWVPVFARKGSRTHLLFGKVFAYCVYVVAASAVVNASILMALSLTAGRGPAQAPASFGFLLFLAYLGIVTFASGRHAVRVVATKRRHEALRTPFHRALALACLVGSSSVVVYALAFWTDASVIFLMLSVVGFMQWREMSSYMSQVPASKMAWWYEHMGSMLGTGIAFHTAFAVFGASRLFGYTLEGPAAFVPWVLPAAIGTPAIAIWTRHYRKKFGDAPQSLETASASP